MINQLFGLLNSHLLLFMAAHIVLLLIFLILCFKDIARPFFLITKKTWAIFSLIFATGFFLRISQFNFYDWFPVHEYAIFLQKMGILTNQCFFGNYSHCLEPQNAVLVPPGYPFLAIIYNFILGFNSLSASYLSGILSGLSILLVFLIACFLFKKESVGLFSALIFSLTPIGIYFSQVSEPRSVSVFFVCLSVLIYLVALRENSPRLWILVSLITSYAVYVRQENLVLFFLFLLGFCLFGRKPDREQLRRLIIPGVLFLILQSYLFLWLLATNPFAHVASSFERPLFEVSYFIPQSFLNIKILFNYLPIGAFWWPTGPFPLRFNFIASGVFFLGCLLVFSKEDRREKLFVLGWFFTFFALYSFYLGCDPETMACDGPVRYTLMFVPAYSILAGYAFFRIQSLFKGEILKIIFLAVISVLIFRTSILTVPKTFFLDQRQTIYADLIKAVGRTPDDCLIISDDAMVARGEMIPGNKRKTIFTQAAMAANNGVFLREASQSSCLIYFPPDDKRRGVDFEAQKVFFDKYFEQEFLFKEGSINAYSIKLRKST